MYAPSKCLDDEIAIRKIVHRMSPLASSIAYLSAARSLTTIKYDWFLTLIDNTYCSMAGKLYTLGI